MSLTEAVLSALQGIRWDTRASASPSDWLQQWRAVMGDALRAAFVYRRATDGFVLWAAAGPSAHAPSHALLDAVGVTSQPHRNGSHLLLPIFVEGEVGGILALHLDNPEAAIEPVALAPLTAYLGEHLLSEETQHVAQAAAQLNACTTFRDIAHTIAPIMVRQGQFITITLFEYDAQAQFRGVRVIATANRKSAYEANEYVQLNISAFTEHLAAIPDDEAGVLFADIADDPAVPDDARQWLLGHRVLSLFVLPLRALGRTYGFLGLNDTRGRIHMPPARAWRLRHLAEHVSATIQRHNLTEATSYTQRIGERLAQTLAELNARQDYGEMVATIARHLVSDAERFVALMQLEADDDGHIADWALLASADRDGPNTQAAPLPTPWRDLPDSLRQYILGGKWHALPADEPANVVFRDSAAALLIPIAIEGRVSALLVIASRAPTPFSREEMNAFANLGEQLGALLQSRYLLEQTRLREQLATQTVEANRRISQADTYGEMAQSALEAASAYVDYVGIALFDRPISRDEAPRYLALVASAWPDRLEELYQQDTFVDGAGVVNALLQALFDEEWRTAPTQERLGTAAPNIAQYLLENGVQSLVIAPLSIANRLQGLLLLGGAAIARPNAPMERNLRLVASQLAAIIENRNLLQRAQATVEELGILQDLNQELLGADDVQSMLEIVRAYVGRDAANLYYLEMAYNEDDVLDDILVRHQFNADGQLESPDLSLKPFTSFSGLTAYWERIGSGLEVIGNFDDLRDEAPIVAMLRAQHIKSLVSIPIFDMGQRTEQISIAWDKPRRFDELDLRLFRAIQTQFTILRQNQKLLRSAQISAARLGIQVRLLRVMNNFTNEINNLADERRILDLTAQVFCAALGVDHVGITLIEPSGEFATVVAEHPGQAAIGLKIEANRGAMLLLKRSSQAMLVRDVASDERLEPQSRAALQSLGVRTVLFLPLLDREKRLFGSIGLDILRDDYQFDDDAVEIAQTLATQAGIAVQKARLQQQTERRNTQLQAVADFSRAVQSARETRYVFENASLTARRILQPHLMSIILKDEQGRFHYVWLSQQGADIAPAHLPALSVGHNLYEPVLDKGEALYIYDLNLHHLQHPLEPSVRSSIVVPLMMRGEVVGALEIGDATPYAYNETDVSVVQQFASLIIAAIENARSYEQALKLAQYKAQSNEIAARLQQQLDMESLLQITAGELGKALGARRARIRLGGLNPPQSDKS